MTKKQAQQHGFEVSRRNFLKAGAAIAATAGIMGASQLSSTKVAKAAFQSEKVYTPAKSGQWSKLRPEADYGGAKVKYALQNDEWLGTTQIVGEVKATHEANHGFNMAARGLFGKQCQAGIITLSPRHPLAEAIKFAAAPLGKREMETGEPNKQKLPILDPEQMSQHIKDFAYFLRCDEVGIGLMPDHAYYTDVVVNEEEMSHNPDPNTILGCAPNWSDHLPYCIVILVDQGLETMLGSTGYDGISVSQSYLGYSATAFASVMIARYLRYLGYNSRAHHNWGYGAVMAPAIIAAGMGELSRTGDCVAHPKWGFRHKVACITTDMPLAPDKPIDFGLQDFCRVCKKCADNCPSGAITHDTDYVEYNGYLRWNSDFKKCTEFRCTNDQGVSCGRCMKVCPWNSKEDSWFHEAGIWIGSHGELSSSFLKSIDDIFGYGTEELEQYKWWIEWPERYKVGEAPDTSLFL